MSVKKSVKISKIKELKEEKKIKETEILKNDENVKNNPKLLEAIDFNIRKNRIKEKNLIVITPYWKFETDPEWTEINKKELANEFEYLQQQKNQIMEQEMRWNERKKELLLRIQEIDRALANFGEGNPLTG